MFVAIIVICAIGACETVTVKALTLSECRAAIDAIKVQQPEATAGPCIEMD